MEYLTDINDSLKSVNEKGIRYINLFEHPELFYGNINSTKDKTDFTKFSSKSKDEIIQFGASAITEMNDYYDTPYGVRLRFSTDSNRLIFKVKLNKRWSKLKIVNWGAYGFDVYGLMNGEYKHRTVFGPNHGFNTFAESILVPENGKLCIFLPNYNSIDEFYMGIDENSEFKTLNYPEKRNSPIIFYGNSVSQGASASHSGNSYPNLVSKILNHDIVNFSCSDCSRGLTSIAEVIGEMDCHSIVIDYDITTDGMKVNEEHVEEFYNIVRKYHPNKRIILLTSENFNHNPQNKVFDEKIIKIYDKALQNSENTFLINQQELFEDRNYDVICVDSRHYTDYAMYIIAKAICEILGK